VGKSTFHLTEFFLFDGEGVQQLAKQERADTVKMGVEGILGVQLLRVLQQDLLAYAQKSRSGVEQIEDETLTHINDQIAETEARLEPCRRQLKQLQEQAAPVDQRIEELTRTLRTMTGGGFENVRELQEEKVTVHGSKAFVHYEKRLNFQVHFSSMLGKRPNFPCGHGLSLKKCRVFAVYICFRPVNGYRE
jgi:DNA sulfur modification protein DndD